MTPSELVEPALMVSSRYAREVETELWLALHSGDGKDAAAALNMLAAENPVRAAAIVQALQESLDSWR